MRGERAGSGEWHWSGEQRGEGRTDTGKGDMGRFGYGRTLCMNSVFLGLGSLWLSIR
jgi:hypothetical protein